MNKQQFVADYVKPMMLAMNKTGYDTGIKDVRYEEHGLFDEQVVVEFKSGTATINVTWDSPWAMLKDIIRQLEDHMS